ncbi:unnamed protein product [Nesidiocoris tenuis]|uniref:Uncharacterized protein n=1 Tax=Nesidiocoris tenuis TaxID=355587 RepID=A0A6H5GSC0_9HEMI|nr:unnamed protein product [Nesidiocoris tenuis]
MIVFQFQTKTFDENLLEMILFESAKENVYTTQKLRGGSLNAYGRFAGSKCLASGGLFLSEHDHPPSGSGVADGAKPSGGPDSRPIITSANQASIFLMYRWIFGTVSPGGKFASRYLVVTLTGVPAS